MEFIKNEVLIKDLPKELRKLLTKIIQRHEKSLDEIIKNIDVENLYAEISGKRKTNFINIGFFENYERNDTTDLVAYCPQIKIKHDTDNNEVTVYFYKEFHSISLRRTKYQSGESKLVAITQDELRYILEEARKLAFLSK